MTFGSYLNLVQEMVQTLVKHFNAKLHFGEDFLDVFCTLTQAKILILSESSTFSQMAAILGQANHVHYPVHTLQEPPVTLLNSQWHII